MKRNRRGGIGLDRLRKGSEGLYQGSTSSACRDLRRCESHRGFEIAEERFADCRLVEARRSTLER